MNQCSHVFPEGNQCDAHPLSGEAYCYFHSPARAKERKISASKGGATPRRKRQKAPLTFTRHSDLAEFLDKVQRGFVKGSVPSDTAKSLVSLVSILGNVRQKMAKENQLNNPAHSREAVRKLFAEKYKRSLPEEFRSLNPEDKALVYEFLSPILAIYPQFAKLSDALRPPESAGLLE